jgi:hypothetical protein
METQLTYGSMRFSIYSGLRQMEMLFPFGERIKEIVSRVPGVKQIRSETPN